jgi:hypothetical protein
LAFALIACQPAQPAQPPLPDAQAAPLITAVQNYVLTNGLSVKGTLESGIKSLAAKGYKVTDEEWRAYPGPADCQNCNVVAFSAVVNNDKEVYEFLVRDGGKFVEGQSDSARIFFVGTPLPTGQKEGGKPEAPKTDAEKLGAKPPEKPEAGKPAPEKTPAKGGEAKPGDKK